MSVLAPLSHVSAWFAASLLSAIWQGAVLAVCVALVLRFLPGITAAARSLVWTAVFCLAMLLFFFAAERSIDAGAVGASAPELHVAEGWAIALAVVWGLCSLVRAVQLGRSALHLRGIVRRATPLSLVKDVKRDVELCASSEVDVPCVAGFRKARILLPVDLLANVSQPDLQQVVLHEMEHLRRKDQWVNLMQKAALVFFPLNPVLLWVERRVCVERELACDDGVVRATSARKAYATCLANLAEHSLMRRGLALALGAWERQTELARRVQRILARPARELNRQQSGALVSLMLVAVAGGGLALTHSPQLVGFSAEPAVHATNYASLGALPVNALPVAGRIGAAHETLTRAVLPQRGARTYSLSALSAKPIAPGGTVERSTNVVVEPRAVEVRAKQAPADRQDRNVTATMVTEKRSSRARQLENASVRGSESASSWVVLTTWRSAPAPERLVPGRVTLAISQDSQFAYAAVPTPDGWLIVQL